MKHENSPPHPSAKKKRVLQRKGLGKKTIKAAVAASALMIAAGGVAPVVGKVLPKAFKTTMVAKASAAIKVFEADKSSVSKDSIGSGYNQLDKSNTEFSGGNYYTSNNPGIKAQWDGIRLEVLDNPTRDWVIIADGNTATSITLFFTAGQDNNNNFQQAHIKIDGAGQYTIGSGLGNFGIQSVYLSEKNIDFLTPEQSTYLRYRAYVKLWNDFDNVNSNNPDLQIEDARNIIEQFHAVGLAHYQALVKVHGPNIPPYFAFEDYTQAEEEWADKLEGVLINALKHQGLSDADIDVYLTNAVKEFGDKRPSGVFE